MPQLLILRSGAKIIVGDTIVKRGWFWWRRIIAEDLQDGKACVYRQRDVMFTKEIPQAEWDANIEAEKKAREEQAKRNPRPGDGPRLVTPRR